MCRVKIRGTLVWIALLYPSVAGLTCWVKVRRTLVWTALLYSGVECLSGEFPKGFRDASFGLMNITEQKNGLSLTSICSLSFCAYASRRDFYPPSLDGYASRRDFYSSRLDG